MSNFFIKAKHKASGEIHEIAVLDDYFENCRTAYARNTGGTIIPMSEEEFYKLYEVEDV